MPTAEPRQPIGAPGDRPSPAAAAPGASNGATPPEARGPALGPRLAALAIALVVGAAYANSLAVPFQFDDWVVVVREPAITGFHLDPASRRFLGDLSFALSYRLFGDRPAGYHVVNVAIHLANALLVFSLARALLRTDGLRRAPRPHGDTAIALLAALLFAAHPLQTQAVTYVAQRYASLCAAFFLLATLSYVRFRLAPDRRSGAGWYALFVASAAAALWTKENAFVLPLAIVLVEWAFFRAPARRRLLFLSPFLAGAAVAGGLALAAGTTLDRIDAATRIGTAISRHDYALTQLRVVASYLGLLVFPVGQNLDHDVRLSHGLLEPAVLASAALHACLLAGAVLTIRRGRRTDGLWSLVGFGVLWFYAALLVESSFLPIPDLMFEHRVYLPSAGLSLGAAALAALLPVLSGRRAWIAVTAALALSLTALTIARNRIWRSELSLWSDSAAKSPAKARPLASLGAALLASGDPRGAIGMYERALRADPGYLKAYFNLGEALRSVGDCAAAIPNFEWFLRWEPRYPEAYRQLLECYRRTGRADSAERLTPMYERALRESGGVLLPSLR